MAILCGALLVFGACGGKNAEPQERDVSVRQDFAEPVKLSSADGVLEVALTAKQGEADLDTVAEPVSNALLFSYQVLKGSSSGSMSAEDTYPAPTLRVNPGEKLIIHLKNDLQGLTIPDFQSTADTPVGQTPPLYPSPMTSTPINLHTHGLHVSPSGNSDNVLLSIPPGSSNTYTYDIPPDHEKGLYWYHSHLHQLTAPQTYMGLAGLIEIGRADGDLPIVTQHELPVRSMALQYNYIFDRQGGLSQLNNINWQQFVNTSATPVGNQLADGTYEAKQYPVNFTDSEQGTQYLAGWSGPGTQLSFNNPQGFFQFIPSNLQAFKGKSGSAPVDVPAQPDLPDYKRDVQYTVNGQFQPNLASRAGQTEIWALANVSDNAFMRVRLTETASGEHPVIKIVGQDGNPYPEVHVPTTNSGTTLEVPPGARYAIAVTIPQSGDLVLEMPSISDDQPGQAQPQSINGVLYTNNGTANSPATLGKITVDPSAISNSDGFFNYPTQVLLRAHADSGEAGTTVDFADGQPLNPSPPIEDLANVKPDLERKFVVTGGAIYQKASIYSPQGLSWEFNDNLFPNSAIVRPRLGTVEDWTVVNKNNLQHPIHIHVNDFQVAEVVDSGQGITTGYQHWNQDIENLPTPQFNFNGTQTTDIAAGVTKPSSIKLRSKFADFTGTYVIHCHRLLHEDNGMMAVVSVIPAVSTYAIAIPGNASRDTSVRVYDSTGDKLISEVTPFVGSKAPVSVAMGDVNGDQVLDLIVGAGAGAKPEVVSYSGVGVDATKPFQHELGRFMAFDSAFTGGVSVASANIDGSPVGQNVIVGSGPGMASEVRIFKRIGEPGTTPDIFASFQPYAGAENGVTLATGEVDLSGRSTIVTSPGPGMPAQVRTFVFPLFDPVATADHSTHSAPVPEPLSGPEPSMTSEFLASHSAQGVNVATGLVDASAGGAASIVVGDRDGSGRVQVFSGESALDGEPNMYLANPSDHHAPLQFRRIANFTVGKSSGGVTVATTSTTGSSDVLVGGRGRVTRYRLVRESPKATTLDPRPLRQIAVGRVTGVALGGA